MAGPYDYITPLAQASQMPQPQEGAALLGGIQQGLQMQFARQQIGMQLAQQQQAFQTQQAALSDPSPDNINRWLIANPQAHEAFTALHSAKTQDAQRQDVQDAAAVYGSLQADNVDGAKAILQRRVDAGQQNLAPILSMLNSGDPAQIKKAQGAAGMMLAGMMGPDKFAEAYNAVGTNERANAEEPYAIQAKRIENAKNSFLIQEAGKQPIPIILDGQGAPSAQPSDAAPAQGGQAPPMAGPAGTQVAAAADAAGATPGQKSYLAATAHLESRGNPNAQNGSSTGVFQMQPATFKALGGTDINDVGQQTQATLKLAAQNAKQMQGQLGRAPTNAEVYLAHQQGATGASALIAAASDPNTTAIQALVGAGVSPAKAKASIIRNRPPGVSAADAANMTAGQFVSGWRDQYVAASGGAQAQGGQQAAAGQAPAGQHYGTPGQGFTLGTPFGSTGMPDQATLQQAAEDWIRTGKTPNDGTRPEGVAINNAVMSLGNKLLAQRGVTPGQLSAMRTRWNSADSNFSSLQGQQGQMEVQEGTVANGLSLAQDLIKNGAGGLTSAKLANMPLNALRRTLGDDPRTNQLEMAMTTAADEYSKILVGQGATTDAARKKAEQMFSPDQSVQKLQGALAFVQQEIAGRKTSGEEQLRYYNAVRISPTAEAPPPASVAKLRNFVKANPAQGAAAAEKFDQKYGRGMAANYLGEI